MSEPQSASTERWADDLASVPGATAVEPRGNTLWMNAPDIDVVSMAELLHRLGFRLSAMTGLALDGESAILYHYCRGSVTLNIRAETRGQSIRSIAPIVAAAEWSEREIADLYGVEFIGHPHPARLVRPPALSPGFFRDGGSSARE